MNHEMDPLNEEILIPLYPNQNKTAFNTEALLLAL